MRSRAEEGAPPRCLEGAEPPRASSAERKKRSRGSGITETNRSFRLRGFSFSQGSKAGALPRRLYFALMMYFRVMYLGVTLNGNDSWLSVYAEDSMLYSP